MTRDERFSMSAVLKYRKKIEEEVAREAASIKDALDGEEQLLADMEARKEMAIGRYREKRLHTVEEVNIFHSFLSTLDASISVQKKKVSGLRKDYDRKMEELISAAMDKKIMETLRDKEWENHRRAVFLSEQKSLDEVAVSRHCRSL